MKCIHCKGVMKKGVVPLHIDRDSCHLTFDNIPAWVCKQCGQAYFEKQEVNTIQELFKTVEEKAHQLSLSN